MSDDEVSFNLGARPNVDSDSDDSGAEDKSIDNRVSESNTDGSDEEDNVIFNLNSTVNYDSEEDNEEESERSIKASESGSGSDSDSDVTFNYSSSQVVVGSKKKYVRELEAVDKSASRLSLKEKGTRHSSKKESSESEEEQEREEPREDEAEDEVEEDEDEDEEEQEESEEEEDVQNTPQPVLTFREKLVQARHNLQLSSRPSSLPGRETEMERIKNYIIGRLLSGTTGGCLYISGTPGTGKTASVREVIAQLVADKTVPKFDHFEINGLQLTHPTKLYVELYKHLYRSRKGHPLTKAAEALSFLEKNLRRANKTAKYRVIVVDEFDCLVSQKQQVIYNLLDWAHNQHSKLILIAIANTMNLPGTLIPKVQSRLGQDRLDFKAYLRPALEAIIVSRLEKLDVFRREAIMLIAAKIAAVSGDCRRALEIGRRALKAAEKCFIAAQGTEEESEKYKVSMEHVDTALKQITPCHSTILKHAVLHQRLFICTCVNENKITGKTESNFQIIANKHIMLCNTHGIPAPAWHTLTSICTHLGDMRFLKVGDVTLDVARPISLEISIDDVLLALADDDLCKKWLNLD